MAPQVSLPGSSLTKPSTDVHELSTIIEKREEEGQEEQYEDKQDGQDCPEGANESDSGGSLIDRADD